MALLIVERVEVGERHLEALVRVTDPALMRTAAVPALPERARSLLPGLARHTCENDDGRDFMRELANTETPHMLEHVAAELMALSGSPRSLRAETSWDFARDGAGVFRVSLEFDDDLVALGALRDGVAIVEWLCARTAEKPDAEEMVARLRELRTR